MNFFDFQDSSLSPQGWQPISGYDYTPEAHTRTCYTCYFTTHPFANCKALQGILKQTLRSEVSGLPSSNNLGPFDLSLSDSSVIFSGFESTITIARVLLTVFTSSVYLKVLKHKITQELQELVTLPESKFCILLTSTLRIAKGHTFKETEHLSVWIPAPFARKLLPLPAAGCEMKLLCKSRPGGLQWTLIKQRKGFVVPKSTAIPEREEHQIPRMAEEGRKGGSLFKKKL